MFFQDVVANFSLKYVSYTGRGIPKGHNSKILRPSASFKNNRIQMKFKKQ